MSAAERQVEVDRLKQLFIEAWRRINQADGIYAAGFGTSEGARFMYPFIMSQKGLEQAARKCIAKGLYTPEKAFDRLRWAIGNSQDIRESVKSAFTFEHPPDVFKLPPRDFAREVHRRLKAACTALQELDAQGLFEKGVERENIRGLSSALLFRFQRAKTLPRSQTQP